MEGIDGQKKPAGSVDGKRSRRDSGLPFLKKTKSIRDRRGSYTSHVRRGMNGYEVTEDRKLKGVATEDYVRKSYKAWRNNLILLYVHRKKKEQREKARRRERQSKLRPKLLKK